NGGTGLPARKSQLTLELCATRRQWVPRALVCTMAASQQEEHLAQSNRDIAEFERRVTEQEARVAEIQSDGSSTQDALKLLDEFGEAIRLAIEQHELMLREMRGEIR